MPINLGCNRLGVEQGGSAIRTYGLNNIFSEDRVVDSGDILCRSISEQAASVGRMKNIDEILQSDAILADKVHDVLKNGEFPLAFGGDHYSEETTHLPGAVCPVSLSTLELISDVSILMLMEISIQRNHHQQEMYMECTCSILWDMEKNNMLIFTIMEERLIRRMFIS